MSYEINPTVDTWPPITRRLIIHLCSAIATSLEGQPSNRIRSLVTRLVAVRRPTPLPDNELLALLNQILTVDSRSRGAQSCLHRSLTLVAVATLLGYRAVWCVGVITHPPFNAHACVESVTGNPIGEPQLANGKGKALYKV